MKGSGNAEAEGEMVMGAGIMSPCALCVRLYMSHSRSLSPICIHNTRFSVGERTSMLMSCGRMCMDE